MMRPLLDPLIPKNWPPGCEFSPRSLVLMSKARAVKALLIEMSTLPIHAPSIRAWQTRLPPASTTAMFIGWASSPALFSPAAMTRRASCNVTLCTDLGAAVLSPAVQRHPVLGSPA